MLTIPRDLNVYSSGMPPIISLSQYDSDFQLVFNLYTSEGTLNIPSGTTAQIQGTKRDGNGYSASATISGNTVTVTGHNQMTACAGANIYEISLTNSGKVLNTINFILAVEPAAMDAGTIQSETVLKELQAIIDSAATSTQAAQDAEAAADRAEAAAEDLSETVQQVETNKQNIATNTEDIADLKSDLRKKTGLSEEAKVALLDCFEHVAWIDEHGQDYYDALYDALYPDSGLVRITATFTQGSTVIYPSTPLNDLKAYLTVTGYYNDGSSGRITDYALSGTLTVGTSTVTVTAEGKTATFDVVVTASYWDYEWSSNSMTLPNYMTASEYDFTTEQGALFAKTPILDLGYTGNCKLQVVLKSYSEDGSGNHIFDLSNNPQICIQNAIVDDDQFIGVKIVLDSSLGTSSEHGMTAININGVNKLIANSNSNIYHTYELTAEDNVYTATIDGEPIAVEQNTNTTPYIPRTGLNSATRDAGFFGAFIKSIKFKRL